MMVLAAVRGDALGVLIGVVVFIVCLCVMGYDGELGLGLLILCGVLTILGFAIYGVVAGKGY